MRRSWLGTCRGSPCHLFCCWSRRRAVLFFSPPVPPCPALHPGSPATYTTTQARTPNPEPGSTAILKLLLTVSNTLHYTSTANNMKQGKQGAYFLFGGKPPSNPHPPARDDQPQAHEPPRQHRKPEPHAMIQPTRTPNPQALHHARELIQRTPNW